MHVHRSWPSPSPSPSSPSPHPHPGGIRSACTYIGAATLGGAQANHLHQRHPAAPASLQNTRSEERQLIACASPAECMPSPAECMREPRSWPSTPPQTPAPGSGGPDTDGPQMGPTASDPRQATGGTHHLLGSPSLVCGARTLLPHTQSCPPTPPSRCSLRPSDEGGQGDRGGAVPAMMPVSTASVVSGDRCRALVLGGLGRTGLGVQRAW